MTVKRSQRLLTRATAVAALAAAWGLLAGACAAGGPGAPVAAPRPQHAGPTTAPPVERLAERATPGARIAAVKASMDVTVFYLRTVGAVRYLAPERHEVPFSPSATQATSAAMSELLAGRPRQLGVTRPFPDGTRLLGVELRGATATVDLSRQALGAAGGDGYPIQALVWTATQSSQVRRVVVQVEGREAGTLDGRPLAPLLGVGTGGRELVRDRTARLAPILLDEPGPRATVRGGRLVVRGRARVAGLIVGLRLRDPSGTVVAQSYAEVPPDVPGWAEFSGALAFDPPARQALWSVEVYAVSPTDGSITYSAAAAVLVGR